MRTTTIMLLLGTLGIACQSASDPKPKLEPEVTKAEPSTVEWPAGVQSALEAPPAEQAANVEAAKAAPIVGTARVGPTQPPKPESVVSRIMAVVDSDSDGKITREEANGALNFVIGGFFFRADADADGKVTAKERKEARADFALDHPEVSNLLAALSTTAAVKTLVDSLGADNDQTVELKQARSTIREAVDATFEALDENSDDVITAEEAAGGVNAAAVAAGRAAFTNADANSDGNLSLQEFQASLDAPLKRVFAAADANQDGKLNDDEASTMMWWLGERIEAVSARGYDLLSKLTEPGSSHR